jgi:hypothetical protein
MQSAGCKQAAFAAVSVIQRMCGTNRLSAASQDVLDLE